MFHYPTLSVCDSWSAQDSLFEFMTGNWENTLHIIKTADLDQYKAISSLGSKSLQQGAVGSALLDNICPNRRTGRYYCHSHLGRPRSPYIVSSKEQVLLRWIHRNADRSMGEIHLRSDRIYRQRTLSLSLNHPNSDYGKWDKKQPVSQILLSIDANSEREGGSLSFHRSDNSHKIDNEIWKY
jgi:hypothetical protein